MKWKQKLEEVGLNEQTISHGLRTKIKDYYSILEGIEELQESIANPTINDDVEELEEQLEEFKETLAEADIKLVKAIETFDKNKERYKEMSKHLVPKGSKKADGSGKKDTTAPAKTQTPAQAQPPVQTPAPAQAQPPAQTPAQTQVAQQGAGVQQSVEVVATGDEPKGDEPKGDEPKGDEPKGDEFKPSKKNNWLWWGFVAVAAVVTLGVVNLAKNDD